MQDRDSLLTRDWEVSPPLQHRVAMNTRISRFNSFEKETKQQQKEKQTVAIVLPKQPLIRSLAVLYYQPAYVF